MPSTRYWVAVLFLLPGLSVRAQEEMVLSPLSPIEAETLPSPAVVTPSAIDAMPSIASASSEDATIQTAAADGEQEKAPEPRLRLHDFWGYRANECNMSWTIGDGDQFGSFWLGPDPYLAAGINSGITAGFGIGFLAGPERTDMPPRLFDFSLGYQIRDVWGDLSYDVSAAVLAASDFEGSSRDGIRFPAHAVGYVPLTPGTDLVLGVDYLDREDIRMLPVAGLLLRPDPDVRLELVFPRPRLELQLTAEKRCYLFGGLGGGTWAVERDSELDDLASLYELQLGIGLSDRADSGEWSSLEFIYLFDRRLEYESGVGDYDIGPTLMIRTVTRH